MLLDKATGANSIVQDKYITISINKKSVEDARTYFARVGADLIAHFGRLGSKCVELETDERLRIFHDFYRVGEESSFHFDIKETRKRDTILRIISAPTQWNLKRTISRWETVMEESFFFVNMRPISKTVW